MGASTSSPEAPFHHRVGSLLSPRWGGIQPLVALQTVDCTKFVGSWFVLFANHEDSGNRENDKGMSG